MEHSEFKNIVTEVKDKLYRFAKRIFPNNEDAEDIVQDSLVKLWLHRDNIDIKNNPEGYSMAITKSVCFDRMRSKHHKRKGINCDISDSEIADWNLNPELKASSNNINELINELINKLPIKWKMVIQLRDIEGFSTEETAKILEMETSNVKMILSRTRKKIRDLLVNKYGYKYHEY